MASNNHANDDQLDDLMYENDYVGASLFIGGGVTNQTSHGGGNQQPSNDQNSRHRTNNKSKLNLYLPNI